MNPITLLIQYLIVSIVILSTLASAPAHPPLIKDGESFKDIQDYIKGSGHKGEVNSVAFSSDGKYIVSGSYDNSIKLWSVEHKKLLHTFEGHSGLVWSVAFSSDGKYIVSGSSDNTVKLWSVEHKKLLHSFEGHSSTVESVAFSSDGKSIVSGSEDKSIKLWSIKEKKLIHSFEGHSGSVLSVAFSPDGKFIVSGSADKSIKLWSIKEKKLIHSFEGHSGSVLSVAFSPDGKFIVSGSWDQSVKLWSIKEKKLVYSFDGHRGSVKTVAFLPNGKFIVSGSSNKNLKFWNIQSKNLQEDIYSKEDNWIWFDDQEKKLYLGDYKDKKNYYIHFSIKEALYNQAENTLSLIIRNDGNLTLNDVDITLLGDTQSINEIQPNQEIKKIFVTKDKIKKDDLIDVVISRKPYRWDLKVKVKTDIKRATFYVVATLLLIGMIASLYITSYYDWYSYVRKISKNPQEVFNLSLSLFLKIQRRMKQIKRLDKFLTDTMITSRKLDEAIKYEKSTNIEKLKLLAKRVEAETVRRDAPYELHFGNSFPLSIDTLVVFFTNATEPQDIQDDLKEAKILKGKIILIIPPEEAMQPLFDKLTRDRKNLYVGLLPSDVTKLLLAPNPKEILARIISSQIALTQISPYQIGGGVNREVIFFGREKIISHIINKGVTNYIVMGGRQVGKSSLLKAIERRYADIDEVECYYISASNESLVEDIKLELEQEEMSDKEFAKFINSSNNRYLFLIDEADDFVRYEKNHEYKSLKFMRSLSEKNNASFILAGFWEIYRYTYFDYESPIKNFGSQFELEELEWEACIELATIPMGTLGLGYANAQIVEDMIRALGQRANLIQISCEYLIENLDPTKRTIEASDIERALANKKLLESFQDWNDISKDTKEQWIDRVVLYSTIANNSFDDAFLQGLIKKHNLAIDSNELDKSLARLRIGYIIKKVGSEYSYRVPIFRSWIMSGDIESRLESEVNNKTKYLPSI